MDFGRGFGGLRLLGFRDFRFPAFRVWGLGFRGLRFRVRVLEWLLDKMVEVLSMPSTLLESIPKM